MGRVFGKLPLNAAEVDVVQALRAQTPSDWLVIPSVRWAKRREDGPVIDGEADVVVLAPDLGMLVIEVKGSREIRITDLGWQRRDAAGWVDLGRSPIEQATSNAYDLKRLVCNANAWGDSFPGLFGWLVVYPNGHVSGVPGLVDQTTLATRNDMTRLNFKVRDALLAKGSDAVGRRFTSGVQAAAAKVLTCSDFRVVPADGAKEVGREKEEIELLTRQQFSALKGLFELPSVAVAGPAGSGKTILAVWHLQSVIDSGGRALYACFNRTLAESLRLRNPGLREHIHSVDSLFGRTCPRVARGSSSLDEFSRVVLPNTVFDEVSGWNDSNKFDAVIVDEAQDLSEDQLIALQCFKKGKGSWSVFMDVRQDLYRRSKHEDVGADVYFKLSHNCRNTVAINAATNACVGGDVLSMPGAPAGVEVVVERVGRLQMANRAFQFAKQWKDASSNSVAILSPRVISDSAMKGHSVGHGISLTEDVADLGHSGKALFSTIRSFKGVEADCVVIVDAISPELGEKFFTAEDLYVACTRAKTRLVILVPDDDSISYFRGRLGSAGQE
ncbi:NERD domain-containing protein [Stenotrophomonas rhizophila]|uniref:nuclease-related domain-containing DEAD/DEAH box helicase n=1 Tax=Stenotrophomonas rhizophila TaxID=216778 RepID=UPI000B895120|nr:NERD domain-containing protein [Stenotrophomonas rhizophila]